MLSAHHLVYILYFQHILTWTSRITQLPLVHRSPVLLRAAQVHIEEEDWKINMLLDLSGDSPEGEKHSPISMSQHKDTCTIF